VFPDSLTLNRRKEIAGLAATTRIPCVYGWTEFVDAGGLVSYGPTLTEGFRALAAFTDDPERRECEHHPHRAGAQHQPDPQHDRGQGARNQGASGAAGARRPDYRVAAASPPPRTGHMTPTASR
jgi:hypothetical protein